MEPTQLDVNNASKASLEMPPPSDDEADVPWKQPPWPLPPIKWKVTYCAVRGCPNMRNNLKINSEYGISFHRFPKNLIRCKKWLDFCDNEMLSDYQLESLFSKSVICCWHFEPSEISEDGRSRLLYNGLVPHVRPPRDRKVIEILSDNDIPQCDKKDGQESTNKCYLPVRPIHPRKKPNVLRVTTFSALQFEQALAPKNILDLSESKNVLILPKQPRLTTVNATANQSLLPVQAIQRIVWSKRPQNSLPVVSSSTTTLGSDTTKKSMMPNSAIFCPARKRLVKVHEISKDVGRTTGRSNSESAPVSENSASQDDENYKFGKTLDALSSARVIYILLGPSLTGVVPLETLISASTKNSMGSGNSLEIESSGKQTDLTESENPNSADIEMCKSTSSSPSEEPVPMKKLKLSINAENASEMQNESGKDNDTPHPKLPGLTPFNPKGSCGMMLKGYKPTESYLYAVTDAVTWNVPNGVLLFFYKNRLDPALSGRISTKPNILSRNSGMLSKYLVPKIRHIGHAIFWKGEIITKEFLSTPPATTEEIFTSSYAESTSHFFEIPRRTLTGITEDYPNCGVNDNKSSDPLEIYDEKWEVSQRSTPETQGSGSNFNENVSSSRVLPVLGVTPSFLPQTMMPSAIIQKVPSSTQPNTKLLVMTNGTLKTVVAVDPVQVPQYAVHAFQAPVATKEKHKGGEKVNTLRIPASLIPILKDKLPMLIGKEGEFKVGKSSFQQILGVLDEFNFKVDKSGRVLRKSKFQANHINTTSGQPLSTQEGPAKESDAEKKRKVIKGPVEKMHKEIVLLRRRNKYLTKQLEKSRNRPLTKQQKREATIETLRDVFSEDQFMFFISQFTNATKAGSYGHRYEPKLYDFCASLYLESRRVYRKLRMMFHLPDYKSVLKNVATPQYFVFPKKQHKKATSSLDASTSTSCEGKMKIEGHNSNRESRLRDIAIEVTAEQPDNTRDEIAIKDEGMKIDYWKIYDSCLNMFLTKKMSIVLPGPSSKVFSNVKFKI
ncbi:uncharacterized protein LOC135938642 isoform X2 [Cloeon dipterum]|uniref:uncharacterized protein LOC135938642 isoform X2 n=1 Tax=Cloeon dipterum TaxID=197152 RepID=UPI00321F9C6D